ncbi:MULTISPECIES: hypothetical protein [Paenibacillus]|nr:hypothetical protein [Paenibacillus lautus]
MELLYAGSICIIEVTGQDSAICNNKGSDHQDQLPLLNKLADFF